MDNLIGFKKRMTAQDGEDGIVEAIFDKLSVNQGWCVEFGAWDGKHLSNTWNLWHNKRWNAVLIEADPERYNLLAENTKDFPNVHCLNHFVTTEGEDCLDNLLQKTNLPHDFDLLSVDVDGFDYHIWKNVQFYRPKGNCSDLRGRTRSTPAVRCLAGWSRQVLEAKDPLKREQLPPRLLS